MTDQDAVLYQVQDGVATVCLNRPERMNAMNNALMQGISDGVQQVRGPFRASAGAHRFRPRFLRWC